MKLFRRLLAPLLVAVAVLIAFGRAGSFPLLNHWDDESNLSENAAVTNPSWDKLEHFWLHPHLGLYVPLTYTAWIATGALSRALSPEPATAPLNPRLFHWLNILLHLGNGLLLWIGLRLLCKSDIAAAIGAVFLSPPPAQVPLAAVDTAVSRGMDDLAERLLTSALVSHAQQGDLHRRLGVLLAKRGRREDAKAHLQMALCIAPQDQEAARALGELEQP